MTPKITYQSRDATYWDNGKSEGHFVLITKDKSRKSWLTGNANWRELQRFTALDDGDFRGKPGQCLATGIHWAEDHGLCAPEDIGSDKMRVVWLSDWITACVEYHNRVDLKMKNWRVAQ